MNSEVIFQENQYASQNKLIYLLYLVIIVIIVSVIYLVKNGEMDIVSMIGLTLLLIILASFLIAKFTVTISKEMITFSYFPIIPKRKILLDDINEISIKAYDPISDFGGYGIRKSGNKMLYSMSGNIAIVIEKKNGKVIYLGTLKAKEFEEIKNAILSKNGF